LFVSSFGTLLMLPPLFSIIMGKQTYASPSIHPDDVGDTNAEHAEETNETNAEIHKNQAADSPPTEEEQGDGPRGNQ
jgi:hypothetical protein